MLLDIIVRDCSGRVVEMVGVLQSGNSIVVPLFDVAPGYEIQADVKDDGGKHLGTYWVFHAFAAKTVTATKFEDGIVAVTDDASNTYIRE